MGYKHFESGVSRYVHGFAVVDVWFPVDMHGRQDVSCSQCQFFRNQSKKCGLNGSVVAYPDRYVGQQCPLQMETNEPIENNFEEENQE